ncbi:PAS/PAC sensor-containing diguanylate cyclase/phosphodiesterase [Klebsiella michiganensis]|uniref:PAS/PAC sensor-containing diguanylate cyclase/phosphodiesterase n=1 Tax=Klebsiella michiganensis TaxID=1134687 RepID=A0A7H4PM44_9ENTR|nr:PAS/PAC sensor-containing diguanylate cyclase/phosphodiesterase [Klebsiella michiganensis]
MTALSYSTQHYQVLWGSFRSESFTEQDTQFLGNGFRALISQHAAALRSGKSAYAGITRTRAGIAFIGIGLIRRRQGGYRCMMIRVAIW